MNDANATTPDRPAPDPGATGPHAPSASLSQLLVVLHQYLADVQAGRLPQREQLLADHPQLAAELERCLAGTEFIHRAAQVQENARTQLGDFLLVREVGRGGMGVVYEAEQLSLKRRVALKVLRLGPVGDDAAMARFQREAEVVAHLHHTHIVPIFAVGCDRGVHYFAMQFIDGTNLAKALEASRKDGDAPFDFADVARWGLQTAEALAYAHRCGVIHRDIKPSNLMLDRDGTLWLTDFGLARRLDDMAQTATGLVLGTPRYMSPEQACLGKDPVEARSDVYSLGATLYELATGKPVFDAGTIREILELILHAEPVPPRQLRPALPRDLETIVLKCLAKEPARRYASAQDLADDLRDFLQGRSIKARRLSLTEQSLRWLRRQRRSVGIAAFAALAAILLVIGASLLWSAYAAGQLGEVVLKNKEEPLTAEVLDEQGEPVVMRRLGARPESIPLPAGSYRLRLSASEKLSETFPLQVEPGSHNQWPVGLGERRLWDALEIGPTEMVELVNLTGNGSDLLLLSSAGLRRLDGATGKLAWSASWGPAKQGAAPRPADYDPETVRTLSMSPRLLQPPPDLNGDGTRDLVWSSSDSLLALSGKDGRVLWRYVSAAMPNQPGGVGRTARIVGQPVVADVDGDGLPDLIGTFTADPPGPVAASYVEALSGRSGKALWRHPLEAHWVPGGKGQAGSLYPAEVVRLGGKTAVLLVAGTRLVSLDARTGGPLWPVRELGFAPAQPPSYRDVDGDGEPEALLFRQEEQGKLTLVVVSLRTGGVIWQRKVMTHTSGSTTTFHFSDAARVHWTGMHQIRQEFEPDWPLVTPLESKGKPVVIVPNSDGPEDFQTGPSLDVLDGATGQPRWSRRWPAGTVIWMSDSRPTRRQLDRFLVGPDLDGDGFREVFLASFDTVRLGESSQRCLFVTALSGRDGHTLWTWKQPLSAGRIASLTWWQEGRDGWPQLLVGCEGDDVATVSHLGPPALFILETSTGKLMHILRDVVQPRVADCDGDGLPDLFVRSPAKPPGGQPAPGRVFGFRGVPAECWRCLGKALPVTDLDGDGVADALVARQLMKGPIIQEARTVALSGRTGEPLWSTPVSLDARSVQSATARSNPLGAVLVPQFDIDGDGTPDLLWGTNLRALSGKSGRKLWEANLGETTPGGVSLASYFPPPQWHKLTGPGARESQLLYVYQWSERTGSSGQLWLAALSSANGTPIWKHLLSDRKDGPPLNNLAVGELDGAGNLQVVVCAVAPGGAFELRMLDGPSGQVRWKRSLGLVDSHWSDHYRTPLQLVADLHGDARADILLIDHVPSSYVPKPGKSVAGHFDLSLLSGRDGQTLWTSRVDESVISFGPHVWGARSRMIRLEGRGRALCVQLQSLQLKRPLGIILDGDGRIVQRVEFEEGNTLDEVLSHDLNRDGHDQLLWIKDGQVRATRDGFDNVCWEWPLPGGRGSLIDVQPGRSGQPPVVTVAAAPGSAVYGLDGKTGRPLWRSLTRQLLGGSDPRLPPRCLVETPMGTVCYQGQALDAADVAFAAPPGQTLTYADAVVDPRLVRQLPWLPFVRTPYFWISALVSLLVLVIPSLLLRGVIRQRSWELALLLAAWLVLAAGIFLWLPEQVYPSEVSAHGFMRDILGNPAFFQDARLLRMLVGLPVCVFLGTLLLSLLRRRWRRTAVVLAMSLALTPVYMGLAFVMDRAALEPEQHYSWSVWYSAWLPAAYATGALLLLVWLLGIVDGAGRNGWRRLGVWRGVVPK